MRLPSIERAAIVVLALCASLIATPTHALDNERPVLIKDPQLLQSLGFSPDRRDVYGYPQRFFQEPPAATLEREGDPVDYYGATSSGFSTHIGQSFKPRMMRPIVQPTQGYFTTAQDLGDLCWIGDDTEYRVQMDLPNGALLQSVRWWAYDDNVTADLIFRIESLCLPNQGPGTPVVTVLAAQSTLGSIGVQSNVIAVNSQVDMKTCTYSVVALFSGVQNSCSQRIYKVRAQWVRQVSPAPATARYLDVPPNHPFFRFVEALAASGITGGCSANQYCPDSAVTRGQMAVFLATALGLNWGGL